MINQNVQQIQKFNPRQFRKEINIGWLINDAIEQLEKMKRKNEIKK